MSIDDKYIDLNPLVIATDTLLKDAVVLITQTPSPNKANCLLVVAAQKLVGILTQTKDGSKNLISWSNTALFNAKGKIEFIIATGIDVTEQPRVWNKLELQCRHIKLLTEITDKIRMSSELDEILQTTVTEVPQLLACDRVLIIKVQSNNTALPIRETISPNLPPMLGYELADTLLIGKYIARYRQGKALARDNLVTASIDLDIKQLLKQFEIQAKLVVPILAQGELKGLLVAHQCHHPRQQIQLFNQRGEKIFGYQASEVLRQPLDISLSEVFRRINHQHVSNFGRAREQSRQKAKRSSNVFGLRKNGREFQAEASIAKLQTK